MSAPVPPGAAPPAIAATRERGAGAAGTAADGPHGVLALAPLMGLIVAAPALALTGIVEISVSSALVLWASATGAVGLVALALRAILTGPTASRAWLAGPLLAAPVLAAFAALVKQSTHHRPLGAATVAVAAAILILGSVVLVWRLGSAAASRSSALGARTWATVWVLALLALTGVAALAVRADEGGARSVVAQGLLLGLGAALLTRAPARLWRGRRGVALALFVGPLTMGAALALADPAARRVALAVQPWLALLGGV